MDPEVETPAREFLDLYGTEAWGDWQRLLTHFDLASGALFLVLLLPGAVGADICRRQLAGHLQANGKRLGILPCTERDEARRLGDRLFELASTDDLGGVWIGSVIPESDREIELWKEAWRHGLSALNQHRNPLLRRFKCPLVLVGAPWLQPLLREAAPDFWSVRSGVVNVVAAPDPREKEFEPQGFRAESVAPPEMMGIAAADPDYALERAESLREKTGAELARAQLLLRAGNGFYEHGRMEPAERCYRESIELFKGLESKSIEVQDQMAAVLNNLATTLGGLGKREEALARAEKGVRIYEELAKPRPDAFLPDLAKSLNNLALRLSELGRREEALARAGEAVRIYEQQAKARPDAFLPDLAGSLNNLANRLSELGRREEALARGEEAVRIYESLAKARPDVFLPDLASSLNNLAVSLSDLGRREEALARAEDAMRIQEQLAKARPDVFLPGLATSFGSHGRIRSGLGNHLEAAISFVQGIRALLPLFRKTPRTFAPLMGQLCADYIRACKQAEIEPDTALLSAVAEVQGRIKTSGT